MSQITYPLEVGQLKAGMKADIAEDVCRSYKNTTGADLPFGVMVALGAADDRLKRLTGPTDKLIGVVVHDHANSSQGLLGQTSAIPFGTTPDTDAFGVPDKRMASVMRSGFIVVAVEAAVGAETDAWVRVTAGAGEVVGAFRGDADGTDALRVEGARFVSSTTGSGFAILELSSPELAAGPGTGGEDLINVVIGAEAGDAIEIAVTLTEPDGTPLTVARQVFVTTAAATAGQGDIAAAAVPVGTLGPVQNPATGDNNAAFLTTAAGLFSFSVTDTIAEDCQVVIYGEGCKTRVLRLTFA